MSDGLILTLGHGSSANLVLANEIVNGYQLERITRVKGDSRFPALAIEEIEWHNEIPNGCPIYVSHWSPSCNVDSMSEKHWNRAYLESRFPNSEIRTLNIGLTHHDAHAYSALAYNTNIPDGSHIIVADGFGNMGEVFSVYKMTSGYPRLISRSFGYQASLGLLYQYATDFVGFKMNQDEWKLNAMAADIIGPRYSPEVVERIQTYANDYANKLITRMNSKLTSGAPDDPVIQLGALSYVHKSIHDTLLKLFPDIDKVKIAYFLQCIVERVLEHWINYLDIQDVTLVGGCFLNVQLNGFVLSKVPGQVCAMPLSGDEGAGFGVFKYYNPDFTIPNDLCWGLRDINISNWEGPIPSEAHFVYGTEEEFRELVVAYLKLDKIVNVVRKGMEYGPRSLCNTSTLALPTADNAAYINHLNARDKAMPMCPVIDNEFYRKNLLGYGRVSRSAGHMIMAMPLKMPSDGFEGVTHKNSHGEVTCRPQVVYPDQWMSPIVSELGPILNTSFNNHRQPICFELDSVFKTHINMLNNDYANRVITLIYPGE